MLLLLSLLILTSCAGVEADHSLIDSNQNKASQAGNSDTAFPSAEPEYVKIFDTDRLLVADHSSVWTSSNGGMIWRVSNGTWDQDGSSKTIRGMSFLENGVIFLAAPDALFRSDDFGESWAKLGEMPFVPKAIFFIDKSNGWAVSTHFPENWQPESQEPLYEGKIFATRDGGRSWFEEKMDNDGISRTLGKWTLNDIFFPTSLKGFAVGDGVILRTEDGGGTWSRVEIAPFRYFKLDARGENLIWVNVIGNDEFPISTNGGITWRLAKYPRTGIDTASFILFLNPDDAILSMGHLYRTLTGGTNWKRVGQWELVSHCDLLLGQKIICLANRDGHTYSIVSDDFGANWAQRKP